MADEDLALEIVMMAGCGLTNGEAGAVNVNSVVAQDVYRVREAIELVRGESRHHEGRLPAARPGWLHHGRKGAAPGEEALRRPSS
ncbi:hypothetical protein [Streptomyces cyaneofuscatus]|uniref:hypothetical protein n=1 Tax=Streptomyces cyaneofuscatus TaxID=66883 RepID=UPI0038187F8C